MAQIHNVDRLEKAREARAETHDYLEAREQKARNRAAAGEEVEDPKSAKAMFKMVERGRDDGPVAEPEAKPVKAHEETMTGAHELVLDLMAAVAKAPYRAMMREKLAGSLVVKDWVKARLGWALGKLGRKERALDVECGLVWFGAWRETGAAAAPAAAAPTTTAPAAAPAPVFGQPMAL